MGRRLQCISVGLIVAAVSTSVSARSAALPMGSVGSAAIAGSTTWSITDTRYGTSSPGTRTDVECVSATWCVRVGTQPSPDYYVPAIEHWNGLQWTTVSAPTQPTGDTSLSSVSCTTTIKCLAVGRSTDALGLPRAFALKWNGSSWSDASPNLGGQPGVINDVSCSGSMCMATGAVSNTLLIARWSGSRWAVQASATGLASDVGKVISCGSATTCTVMGSSSSLPFSMQLQNGVWTASTTAIGPQSLSALSCTSGAFCMAVGADPTPFGAATRVTVGWYPSVHLWDGSTWGRVAAPSLDVATFKGLDCAAPDDCIATGETFPHWTTISGSMFASHWDGAAWVQSSLPAAGEAEHLDAVSCGGTSRCMAIGSATQQVLLNGSVYVSGYKFVLAMEPGTTRHVEVSWSASEVARIDEIAQYLGVTQSDVQRNAVYAVAFLAGLLPAGQAPVTMELPGSGATLVTDWDLTEFSVMQAVTSKFALSDSDAVRFSVNLLGFLLALGGH